MLIKEYRIIIPLTVKEYELAHAYMVAKATLTQNTAADTSHMIANEPFDNDMGKGRFYHRVFKLGSRLPSWIFHLLKGNEYLIVEEKTWNMYPYIKSVYSCPLLGSKPLFTVETRHVDDNGTTYNVHNLNGDILSKRIIDTIDIAHDPIDSKYYKAEEDPRIFISKKTSRGPLKPGWQKECKPIMCTYKLVTIDFPYWGIRTTAEKMIHDVLRNIYLNFNRQTFCLIDQWIELPISQVRQIEKEATDKAKKTPLIRSRL